MTVIRLLNEAGLLARKNPEKRDRAKMIQWDVESQVGSRQFTVEVKFDAYEAKSGNVAVEHFNVKQCKPSGISATTADLWCFVFADGSVWVARVSDLKKFVAATKAFRDIACGGDDNAAIKLFRRDHILPGVPFHRVDGLAVWDLTALLRDLLGEVVERAAAA